MREIKNLLFNNSSSVSLPRHFLSSDSPRLFLGPSLDNSLFWRDTKNYEYLMLNETHSNTHTLTHTQTQRKRQPERHKND